MVFKINHAVRLSDNFRKYLQLNNNIYKIVLINGLHTNNKQISIQQKALQEREDTKIQRDPLNTSFNNPEAAYKSKTTWEIIRAYIVYTLCSSNYLVDNNVKLMKITKRIFGEKIFGYMMKLTFYGHFVAGEDTEKIRPILERLREFGVKPILDYSVEEDISQEEAEKIDTEALSTPKHEKTEEEEIAESIGGELPQYHVEEERVHDRRWHVSSARTYFYLNEATCEKNVEIFQECLRATASNTYGTGITAVKLTALGRPNLLLQLSEVIIRARRFVSDVVGGSGNVIGQKMTPEQLEERLAQAGVKDTKKFLEKVTKDSEGVIHLFPWSGIIDENLELNEAFRIPSLKAGRMVRLIHELSAKEEEMFRNMIRRISTIVRTAKQLDVRIMVDAEQTYLQPAISRITMEMMRKYNTHKGIVYNTYQCYLKDVFNEITTDLEQAKRQNFYFGCKLVRGAYIEQERERAKEMSYTDPINPTYEATSDMYQSVLAECLRRIKDLKVKGQDMQKIAIMVASHNEDTVRHAIDKMKEIDIQPEDKVICFGQLLGMCDYITFPLGQAGYSVYKYIPYGPVNEVLPYLSRRAVENKGILKKIKKEKRLLIAELLRRIKTGQVWYTPKGNYRPI